jgi:methionyl-tRNA formyltransferase
MYYREPEYVGVTIHIATPDVDAGEIICQIRPSIKVSDTLYDINMDTIKQGAYAFLHGSIAYHDGRKSISQRALYNGDERICKKRDLTENAVLKVFENFNSGMLLEYINDYDKLTEKVKIISLTK